MCVGLCISPIFPPPLSLVWKVRAVYADLRDTARVNCVIFVALTALEAIDLFPSDEMFAQLSICKQSRLYFTAPTSAKVRYTIPSDVKFDVNSAAVSIFGEK